MGNRLFKEAKNAVQNAINATGSGQHELINIAKNSLSSAYANSTMAQKKQLRQLQEELDQLT